MLTHIALLNFKDDAAESDKRIAAVKIKSALENLKGKVNGLEDIYVENILLDISTADVLLICKLENEQALENLKNTPLLFNIKPVLDEYLDRIHTADYISTQGNDRK